ncbi:hypothetical protein [uncultured Sphingomonas sp.]|uniref:hypothetical protein n=1 Tax=uncultured Sphingomonas sp. TaxID=158754 RepID=UPI0035CBDF8E
MTDLLTLVRDVAMQLPGAQERVVEGGAEFLVEGNPFARVIGGALSVPSGGDGWAEPKHGDDADQTLIEDAVARSWELTAPAGLLEAGGR